MKLFECFIHLMQFWTLGLPDEVHSNRSCLSVCLSASCQSSNISETAQRIFLIFCMKVVHHKGTKVIEPDFWKKSWGVTNGGKPHFGGIFDVFCPYLHPVIKTFWNSIYVISSRLSNTSRKPHFWEKSGYDTYFLDLIVFSAFLVCLYIMSVVIVSVELDSLKFGQGLLYL